MLRQCAWCWSVADAAGRYRFQPGAKLYDATHGICPACAAHELASLETRAAAEGRTLRPALDR
jgi:hypothetical protein